MRECRERRIKGKINEEKKQEEERLWREDIRQRRSRRKVKTESEKKDQNQNVGERQVNWS